MCNFIKGRWLWHYIIATIVQPVQKEDEDAETFVDPLEEWDNRNHQIITWFDNTSQLSIQLQFVDLNNQIALWLSCSLLYYHRSFTSVSVVTNSKWTQTRTQSINWWFSLLYAIPLGLTSPFWTWVEWSYRCRKILNLLGSLVINTNYHGIT